MLVGLSLELKPKITYFHCKVKFSSTFPTKSSSLHFDKRNDKGSDKINEQLSLASAWKSQTFFFSPVNTSLTNWFQYAITFGFETASFWKRARLICYNYYNDRRNIFDQQGSDLVRGVGVAGNLIFFAVRTTYYRRNFTNHGCEFTWWYGNVMFSICSDVWRDLVAFGACVRKRAWKLSGWYLRKSRVQIPATIHLRERAELVDYWCCARLAKEEWTRNSSSRGEKLFLYLRILLNCDLKAEEWIWARPASV